MRCLSYAILWLRSNLLQFDCCLLFGTVRVCAVFNEKYNTNILTLFFLRKIRIENYEERERFLLSYCRNINYHGVSFWRVNFDNKFSDAGHFECSRGPHWTHEPQVPHPWFKLLMSNAVAALWNFSVSLLNVKLSCWRTVLPSRNLHSNTRRKLHWRMRLSILPGKYFGSGALT